MISAKELKKIIGDVFGQGLWLALPRPPGHGPYGPLPSSLGLTAESHALWLKHLSPSFLLAVVRSHSKPLRSAHRLQCMAVSNIKPAETRQILQCFKPVTSISASSESQPSLCLTANQ